MTFSMARLWKTGLIIMSAPEICYKKWSYIYILCGFGTWPALHKHQVTHDQGCSVGYGARLWLMVSKCHWTQQNCKEQRENHLFLATLSWTYWVLLNARPSIAWPGPRRSDLITGDCPFTHFTPSNRAQGVSWAECEYGVDTKVRLDL